MAQNQKGSSGKQNLSTNRRGKRKSRDVKEPEHAIRVWHRTIIGMNRGNTNMKRPREQSEQWMSNEISFPSISGFQLVDSPIILEALIEGFQVHRIYVDGGSSSEVMYENCFRNLRAEIKAKLKESRTPLVSHSPYNVILGRTGLKSLGAVASTIYSKIKFPTANGIATMTTKRETLQECQRMEEAQGPAIEGRTIPPRMQVSESERTTSKGKEENEKGKGEDESLKKSPGSKPPEKVSPLECSKDKFGLDASAKLTRAKLNKRSRDVGLSKDKLGSESPPEFRRSCPREGPQSLLGDEGLSSGGTKINSVFITVE
ncbi:hypothetical protein Tco_1323708, partial [Tanacetum coccineum]